MNYSRANLLSLFLILVSIHLAAQQPKSPLLASFEEYKKAKANSPYDMHWVQIGPTINSARAEAIQVDHRNPGTMYLAFGSGNLWKTVNNGLSWKPIFEDQAALGIGDIALAPSDPNILYLGTGESLKKARNFTMPGTGVYRSDDAGETWRHLGLNDSWHIGEIVVHPTNPDIVLVAVLGHFWSDNPNRGVYRTENGGKTWEQVLYIDEQTGANDIVIAPSNPEVVYASMWQHSPDVHGKNSGVYKSTDGGKSWKKAHKGMPRDKDVGRIGLAVSHQNPDKVYALMDHRNRKQGKGAAKIFRTLDGGKSWKKTHHDEQYFLSVIGWYFADIYVNPQDDEEIYGLGVRLAHSSDGGKTIDFVAGDVFHLFPSAADPLHLDHCELWINPTNPNHLALANDGGLYTTYDRGKHWTHHNNLPTGEFYDIELSKETPYTIYGGVQDDATVYGPSKEYDARYHKDWKYLWVDAWSGGDGCVTCVDPVDPNTVYFSMQNGNSLRRDMKTGYSVSMAPNFGEDSTKTADFNFISPYFISKYDHKTLYHGGNYVFKTTNQGDDWKAISPDLTVSSNPAKNSLAAGAIAESPVKAGLLYMGTDHGAFWVSENDGANWTENSSGLPNAYIRSIAPSKYKEGRVYTSLSGINYDDLSNHLYVSEDHGANWKSISGNLPNEVANVIIEDPTHENLLFASMYRGVYVSTDRGQRWSLLGKNLPAVSVADLVIDEVSKDLVIGTHGRGIYKVNLGPLYEFLDETQPDVNLFTLPEFRLPRLRDTHRDVDYESHQKTTISYYLDKASQVTLEIINAKDETIWSKELEGISGINEYRWDLIIGKQKSNQPYFYRYDRFIRAGDYTLVVKTSGASASQIFTVLAYHQK